MHNSQEKVLHYNQVIGETQAMLRLESRRFRKKWNATRQVRRIKTILSDLDSPEIESEIYYQDD